MTSSLQQFLSGRPDPIVPGYRVLARAWDDLRTIVFSAEDLRTGARVLIKVPRSQHPSAQDLEQMELRASRLRMLRVAPVEREDLHPDAGPGSCVLAFRPRAPMMK